jgi:hypothetical protein
MTSAAHAFSSAFQRVAWSNLAAQLAEQIAPRLARVLPFGTLLVIGPCTGLLGAVIPPNAMLGRVSALVIMATFGARPIGAAIGAQFGNEACLLVSLAGFGVQFLLITGSSVARLQKLPELAV